MYDFFLFRCPGAEFRFRIFGGFWSQQGTPGQNPNENFDKSYLRSDLEDGSRFFKITPRNRPVRVLGGEEPQGFGFSNLQDKSQSPRV